MDILSPLILLHENGYKALAPANGGGDLKVVMADLRDKIVRVGDGDLDVTVGFDIRKDDIGDLGRVFNRMVHQLYGSREAAERQYYAQLSRAECLAAVGELATGRAHEIRNLLAGIAGVIDIIGEDLPVNSPSRAAVKGLRAEIGQITRFLADLLRAARPHPTEIHSGNLNTTVEHAVVLARQHVLSKPIRIELKKDPILANVEHDSAQIQQVVLNLLLNAIQAIGGVGTIRVETSLFQCDATITVADTGRSIAPEHLPHIFEAFYTTKGNGTGLGLSIAGRTIRDHHGRIEVSSEPGSGTTFSVVLPLQQGVTVSSRDLEASPFTSY